MVGVLGIYVVTHLYFLPIEITLLIKFTNPYLIYYIYLIMLFIALKYTLLIEVFTLGFKKVKASLLSLLLILVGSLILTLLGCTIHMVYSGIRIGSLIDSPYLLDYLGCITVCVFGIMYNGFIILKQKILIYHSIPTPTV